MFATIASLIWGGAHLYVAWSLGRFIRRRRLKYVLWGVLATSFAVSFASLLLRRVDADLTFASTLQWVAYLFMGTFVLLWFLVVLRDLLLLVGKGARKLAGASNSQASVPDDPSRRELFRGAVNASLIGVAATGTVLGYREARRLARVKEVEVPIEGLSEALDGFKIVQVSDVHVGPTIKGDYLSAVVERVNGLDPDLIAFTGDMVDGYVDDLREEVASIRKLRARHGAFWVTGNHEYYWDGQGWCDEVARCGLNVLNNSHRVIEHGGARMVVGGVTDYRAGSRVDGHESDPHRAIEGAPEADFRLLLAHQPKSVWEASKAGFDLQLSGHTHGGQFWPWAVFVGFAHPFVRGLNDYEKMKIYVSSGTGYWGPPMRLGVPSEITLLTLRRA